jgi:hypothetical protein
VSSGFALAARAARSRLARARSFYFAQQKKILYFALQQNFSMKLNHQPQYMCYHYTNTLLEITIF